MGSKFSFFNATFACTALCIQNRMQQDATKHIERMNETAAHCQICSKYFNSKWELEWHVWQIHLGKHRYQHYGAKFPRQSGLIRHLKLKRKMKKRYFRRPSAPQNVDHRTIPTRTIRLRRNKNNLLIEICLKCITVYYL